MTAVIRPKENICLICGAVSTGRKHIRAEKAGIEFKVEVPLCDDHKGLPDQDLLKAVEISLEKYAERVHQEQQQPPKGSVDLDDLTPDEIKQVGSKFRNAPCLVCDNPRHTEIRKIPYNGKIAIIPLCSECSVCGNKILTQSLEFLNAAYTTRPSRQHTIRE